MTKAIRSFLPRHYLLDQIVVIQSSQFIININQLSWLQSLLFCRESNRHQRITIGIQFSLSPTPRILKSSDRQILYCSTIKNTVPSCELLHFLDTRCIRHGDTNSYIRVILHLQNIPC